MSFSDTLRSLVMKKPPVMQVTNPRVRSGQSAPENPYLNARRTWNDQAAANAATRQMWQILGILSLLIALGSVAGLVLLSQQSKVIPYVVEVDKLGNLAGAGFAQQTSTIDPRVQKATLGNWITNLRMVTPDAQLQRRAIFKVYALLHSGDPAFIKANEFLNGDEKKNPFARAETLLVDTDIDSMLQQTATTWQVEWTETTRDRQGAPKGEPAHWRALLTVAIVPPASDTTERQLLDNPLGIYIKDFVWTLVK
jgi:type IV secretion system protein VirB5